MPRSSYAPTIEEQIESLKTHMVKAKSDLGSSKKKIDQEYLAHLEREMERLIQSKGAKGGRKSRRVRQSRKSKQSRKSRKA